MQGYAGGCSTPGYGRAQYTKIQQVQYTGVQYTRDGRGIHYSSGRTEEYIILQDGGSTASLQDGGSTVSLQDGGGL